MGVLISLTAKGLKVLLSIVLREINKLLMALSQPKSKVISPDDEDWSILNDMGQVIMCLDSVLKYKYLGIQTWGSMFKTGIEKMKQSIQAANRYRAACLKVSHDGPDSAQLALSCRSAMGIPAILFGTESICFNKSTIMALEVIQNGLIKAILGLTRNAPNISLQVIAGVKTVKHRLYEKQIQFYFRLLNLSGNHWASKAFMEHASLKWKSPYLEYIYRIRQEVNMLVMPSSKSMISLLLNNHFANMVNKSLASMDLPAVSMITRFHCGRFVSEDEPIKEINRFLMSNAAIGYKVPRVGYLRQMFCPLCPRQVLLCEIHLFSCQSLSGVRKETGIDTFMNLCMLYGNNFTTAYMFYLNGKDINGYWVQKDDMYSRGKALMALVQDFLRQW